MNKGLWELKTYQKKKKKNFIESFYFLWVSRIEDYLGIMKQGSGDYSYPKDYGRHRCQAKTVPGDIKQAGKTFYSRLWQ